MNTGLLGAVWPSTKPRSVGASTASMTSAVKRSFAPTTAALSLPPRPVDPPFAVLGVHVLGFAADVGLIDLYGAVEEAERLLIGPRLTNPVAQVPSRPVDDAQVTMQFHA